MKVTITPAQLSGKIKAIASKSVAHRQLICASFSDRPTKIKCQKTSRDIIATADCLNALGANIAYNDGIFYVEPIKELRKNPVLDCCESGSTLRFMLPVVCALGIEASFKMEGRLPDRPLSPMWEELIAHGALLSKPKREIIAVSGNLKGGSFKIRGDISSQFITGLLFAVSLMKEKCTIDITSEIQSMPYINITCDVLEKFGIITEFSEKENSFSVSGSFSAKEEYEADGDWSNGAFWICADELSKNKIECTGLSEASAQGDKEILNAIKELKKENSVIDGADIPDLIPIISVVASVSPGITTVVNAGRLKIKESDRLFAVNELINKLGGKCETTEDGLIITGVGKLRGGEIDSFNDHRIAMSAAVASIVCENKVIINNAQAVEKSYPDFWEDFKMLGGNTDID